MKAKVFVVTVTYGDRFHLLREIVERCLEIDVGKIIIVDNNSSKKTKQKLKELEKKYKSKLKIIYLPENKGSAGGYKVGLTEAFKDEDCEYILTLDDDNLIPTDALRKVECLLQYLDEYKKNEIMLGFYRPMWKWDQKAVLEGWVKSYKPNNFLGFNLSEKIIKKIKKLLNLEKRKNLVFPLQPAEVTAMGGLFFHKSVINKIGYPKEEFFLYAEDHEYTYRFTKSGGKIFLCSEIVVQDLETTYMDEKNQKKLHFFNKEFSEVKLYYAIRNHTYLSKQFIQNKFVFLINLVSWLIIQFKYICKTDPKFFFRRYKLLIRAIIDGLRENLGKTF